MQKKYYVLSLLLHLIFLFPLFFLCQKSSSEKEIVTVFLGYQNFNQRDPEKRSRIDKIQEKMGVGDRKIIGPMGGRSYNDEHFGWPGPTEHQEKPELVQKLEVFEKGKDEEGRQDRIDMAFSFSEGKETVSSSVIGVEIAQDGGSISVPSRFGISGSRGKEGSLEGSGSYSSGTGRGDIGSGLGGKEGRYGWKKGEGTSGSADYLRINLAYIREIIMKNLKYPHIARIRGYEGDIVVSILINEKGIPEDIKILSNSGNELLAKNLIETIKAIGKFPEPPTKVRVIIPVAYRLK
ncbi:MAG: TonB family protein [Desulfobacterota bacterium]|nr:TonB family protein [Thermodesulfobacteriota bacterium]